MKHVQTARWLWDVVTDVNDAIIPGRGKLFGLGKRDWIQPWDAIPFVGPINKANKARKIAKSERVTMYVVAGIGMAADMLKVAPAVVWYNSRYRTLAEAIEEESSPIARRGNAVGLGGGTKKKPYSSRSTSTAKYVKCNAPGRRQFGGKCIRRKGHSGPHFYK